MIYRCTKSLGHILTVNISRIKTYIKSTWHIQKVCNFKFIVEYSKMFNVNTIGHTTHIKQSNSCQTRPGIALLMVETSYVIRPFLLAGHKHLSAMNLPCHLTMDFLSSSFFSYFFFFFAKCTLKKCP